MDSLDQVIQGATNVATEACLRAHEIGLNKAREEMSKAFIGKPAPEFNISAVIGGHSKNVSLNDYKGKYVVLFFYPLNCTFVCPTEIIAFSDRVKEFRDVGCQVLAASTDSQLGFGEMDIPVLADTNHQLSRDYGVFKEGKGIAFRGLFLIDPKGILRQITINDLPVGLSVDETLRLVQAFQFGDKHGEVCPANWKPGKDTIDTKKPKEYFEKQ
uniref:thioredoxin-dependent peroxiredoxin n=1 Tax=Panagrolaimus davidi TaxID=227884 RepID=A0A914P6D9_9BILA